MENKVECTLYTSNGFQLHGTILGHDETAIKLKDKNGKFHAVLLTNLSTIDGPEEVF